MKLLLLLPIVAIVLVSGCTIPGTDWVLPIPGFDNVISLENDIVVITSLNAIPEKVTVPQPIKLIATVQNRGDRKFSPGSFSSSSEAIMIDLFDFCQGLFDNVRVESCPNPPEGAKCRITELLPQETVEVRWVLNPSENTKLITPCELKVSASYPYETSGLTTVHFINSVEYTNQLAQGTFTPKTSTKSLGQGPVKVWFEVKDQQPIPASSTEITGSGTRIPVNLVIDNRGFGFVKVLDDATSKNEQVKLIETNIFSPPFSADQGEGKCTFTPNDKIRLIQDERILPCNIKQLQDCATGTLGSNCVTKETTFKLEASIYYIYEFRDSVDVIVEPGIQS